jgi:hypothetical protein
MQRRPVSPFSLSFLDIMFCGFGAVVLLVLILNADTVKARNETFADLGSEVIRLEQEVLLGQDDLVLARNSVATAEQEQVIAAGEAERIDATIKALERQIATMENTTQASREHINKLSSELRTLDTEQQRQTEKATAGSDAGDKVRAYRGEGDRQYLTGLKVGGKRVLILIDVSASMLDETIINVVRRRNMDAANRRTAPKWRRTLATAGWLISNLPASSQFQLYAFNTTASPVIAGSDGKWLQAANRKDADGAVNALQQLVPADGTSLYQALAVAKKLSPRPDNILLVTDGLPTQGSSKPRSTTVSAAERLQHFEAAVRSLSAGIPVNTILLPMEGDAVAAAAYWKLAIDTQGSFMTPARDWP